MSLYCKSIDGLWSSNKWETNLQS